MKVGVIGVGHLGQVTAVSVAERHTVLQFDERPPLIREDQRPASSEPGWAESVARVQNRLIRATDREILRQCGVLWVAYDTPLDSAGAPDCAVLLDRIARLAPIVTETIPVILSSQWPIGTTATLERAMPGARLIYVPENIRVGKALADFIHQPRIIVGTRNALDQDFAVNFLRATFSPSQHLEFMTIESAEMSKHALNAFLALQIAFINEIARICNVDGAHVDDVSRALLTDSRISPQAYLKAGAPFGGGSLQRDVMTLNALSAAKRLHTPILDAILPSNDSHALIEMRDRSALR